MSAILLAQLQQMYIPLLAPYSPLAFNLILKILYLLLVIREPSLHPHKFVAYRQRLLIACALDSLSVHFLLCFLDVCLKKNDRFHDASDQAVRFANFSLVGHGRVNIFDSLGFFGEVRFVDFTFVCMFLDRAVLIYFSFRG